MVPGVMPVMAPPKLRSWLLSKLTFDELFNRDEGMGRVAPRSSVKNITSNI
jgi:hypothetical protein